MTQCNERNNVVMKNMQVFNGEMQKVDEFEWNGLISFEIFKLTIKDQRLVNLRGVDIIIILPFCWFDWLNFITVFTNINLPTRPKPIICICMDVST